VEPWFEVTRTVGMPVKLSSGIATIWGTLSNILADGDGFRIGYDWRGAASMKPCLVHSNVLRKGSDLLAFSDNYVDICCHDMALFRSWPDSELDRVIALLQETRRREVARLLPKCRAEEIQQACGLHYNEHGMIASPALRANFRLLGVVTYDWVHTLFQDGVFVLEASLLLQRCSDVVQVLIRVRCPINALLVWRRCRSFVNGMHEAVHRSGHARFLGNQHPNDN
jgi:hypothetical protein